MMTNRIFSRAASVLAFCLLALLLAAPVLAQTPDAADLTRQTLGWKTWLDRVDEEIKNHNLDDERLSDLAAGLEKLNANIQKFIATNKPFAIDAKTLLDKLGKPPKEGEPPEAESVARQRKELGESFSDTDGGIRSATALGERSEQLRELVHNQRRTLFTSQILKKGRSPFALSLWQEGVPGFSKSLAQISTIASNWALTHSSSKLFLLVLAAILTGLALFILMRRLIAAYRVYPAGPQPPFFQKAAAAGIVSLMRALPFACAALIITGGMHYFDMLSYPVSEIMPVGLGAFLAIAVIAAISTTLLAPRHRLWRIFPVASSVATRLNRLLLAIAIIYGLDLFLNAVNQILLMPLSLTILQSAIASVLFAGLLSAILRTPFQTHKLAAEPTPGGLLKLLKMPLWGIVFAVLAATAMGYISLARFLTQQTVVTGSILVIAYLAYLSIGEFTDSFGDNSKTAGRYLASSFGLSDQRREQLGAVSMLALNGLLILLTLPFLALQWGFGWNDVWSWSRKLLFGFEFGGLHISLAAMLVATSLFLLGVFLTKMFQRWLDQRILSKSHSQTGAEDSIRTAVGYLGIVLSALLAISYTGIGFSNIAIIAGALSVGIGFGLQSIVNNFVSGLILLAERPIKVGDWIIVGNDEGNVKRISVRSTEIETFDRAHIIIPNSQLISGTVKNWTLRGHLGRSEIRIGVSYDADPEEVQKLLLDIANKHVEVLEYPAPYVVFADFGANSLDFILRIYLSDINKSLTVRSQMRFEILRALRRANIEIPFPQTDLHLRDMDRLEKAMYPSTSPSQAPPQGKKRRQKQNK